MQSLLKNKSFFHIDYLCRGKICICPGFLCYNIGMELKKELKQLIIDTLGLEDITPDDIADSEPLFGEGLGLDSIDALELGMALKKEYNITLGSDKNENEKAFYSIDTLCKLVESKVNG